MNKLIQYLNTKIGKSSTLLLCLSMSIIIPQMLFAEASSNYEISSCLMCAGGVPIESSNYTLPRSTIGDIFGETSIAPTIELSSGYIHQIEIITPIIDEEDGNLDIEVTGTIDDNDATVDVNGIEAQVGDHTFSATITLHEGSNTITITATDQSLNTTQEEITVYLDTKVPRRPTLNPIESPTSLSTQILSGTKETNTSIWINGAEVVPVDSSTTWSYEVSLNSGDNSFTVLSKDRAANESTAVIANIILDLQAPAVTIDSPADGSRTNYPLITVSGAVNDSNSEVYVNGVKATVVGNTFTAEAVPLTQSGPNIITAQATNSEAHTSVDTIIVILGRLPIITHFTPEDGAKFYEGEVIQSQVTAMDLDGGSIEYQFILDGIVEQSWSITPTYSWSTTEGNSGQHTLTVEVKDDYGGKATSTSELYIHVKPVAFPAQ